MNNIRIACMLALALAGAGTFADTYRDSLGRSRGTSTTDRSGKTTYRDSMGRVTCTATRDASGTITYRDSMGRVIGTQK